MWASVSDFAQLSTAVESKLLCLLTFRDNCSRLSDKSIKSFSIQAWSWCNKGQLTDVNTTINSHNVNLSEIICPTDKLPETLNPIYPGNIYQPRKWLSINRCGLLKTKSSNQIFFLLSGFIFKCSMTHKPQKTFPVWFTEAPKRATLSNAIIRQTSMCED